MDPKMYTKPEGDPWVHLYKYIIAKERDNLQQRDHEEFRRFLRTAIESEPTSIRVREGEWNNEDAEIQSSYYDKVHNVMGTLLQTELFPYALIPILRMIREHITVLKGKVEKIKKSQISAEEKTALIGQIRPDWDTLVRLDEEAGCTYVFNMLSAHFYKTGPLAEQLMWILDEEKEFKTIHGETYVVYLQEDDEGAYMQLLDVLDHSPLIGENGFSAQSIELRCKILRVILSVNRFSFDANFLDLMPMRQWNRLTMSQIEREFCEFLERCFPIVEPIWAFLYENRILPVLTFYKEKHAGLLSHLHRMVTVSYMSYTSQCKAEAIDIPQEANSRLLVLVSLIQQWIMEPPTGESQSNSKRVKLESCLRCSCDRIIDF
jgi:hypothetical protein